jgi:hypothetical protein
MEMAWIYHPGLDRTVQVPASSVRVWVQSGWEPAEPPRAPVKQDDRGPTRRRKSKDQPAPVGVETEE